MPVIKRALMGVGVAAIAVSALGSMAGVASADPTCSSKEVCFWEDTNFGGNDVYTTEGYESNWPNYIENKDSAASNHGTSGLGVRVYDYHDYQTRIYCIPSGVAWGSLNPHDHGSSHGWGAC